MQRTFLVAIRRCSVRVRRSARGKPVPKLVRQNLHAHPGHTRPPAQVELLRIKHDSRTLGRLHGRDRKGRFGHWYSACACKRRADVVVVGEVVLHIHGAEKTVSVQVVVAHCLRAGCARHVHVCVGKHGKKEGDQLGDARLHCKAWLVATSACLRVELCRYDGCIHGFEPAQGMCQ